MDTVIRTLANGETLKVNSAVENGTVYYKATVSSDQGNQGFEGDRGEVTEGETLETIADELELWLNDNIQE